MIGLPWAATKDGCENSVPTRNMIIRENKRIDFLMALSPFMVRFRLFFFAQRIKGHHLF
jgi:hypothetical protein